MRQRFLTITPAKRNPAENFEGFAPAGVIVTELIMHLPTLLRTVLLATTLVAGAAVVAADKKPAPAAAKPADDYPLKTCVVSDEALGSMGDSVKYVHKEAGKPDRVVRFCCEGCIDDFKKEPAKFLKKLDAAAAKKPAAK